MNCATESGKGLFLDWTAAFPVCQTWPQVIYQNVCISASPYKQVQGGLQKARFKKSGHSPTITFSVLTLQIFACHRSGLVRVRFH